MVPTSSCPGTTTDGLIVKPQRVGERILGRGRGTRLPLHFVPSGLLARGILPGRRTRSSPLSAQLEDSKGASIQGLVERTSTQGEPAGSPSQLPAVDVLKYLALAGAFTAGAYVFHPDLVQFVANLEQGLSVGDLVGTDSRLFSFLSLVFSILVGSTFKFQYGRQQLCLRAYYEEVLALEVLWRRVRNQASEIADVVAADMRRYIDRELFSMDGGSSPFRPNSAVMELSKVVARCNKQETTEELRNDIDNLCVAHSKRAAVSVKILPPMHWALLWSLVLIFLTLYLLFEGPEVASSMGNMVTGQRLIFALLAGLGSSIILVVQDLSKPVEGTYSLFGPLEERLKYLTNDLQAPQNR